MDEKPVKLTREDRLAAKLRENLRRRKAQARQVGTDKMPEPQNAELQNAELQNNAALSKTRS